MATDCKHAAILQALAQGFIGVQSSALLQLLGKQLNVWARHAVAASADLATQDEHKEDLKHLAGCMLGEAFPARPC